MNRTVFRFDKCMILWIECFGFSFQDKITLYIILEKVKS